MDIEHLNKTQIVLLTLLVSFVTSIATGIATVSLIEKAPADVTRVISRIVEQPIETIVPGEREVITQTVVVQESDLIARAVEEVQESIVRIYRDAVAEKNFMGFGIVTDANGTIAVNGENLRERGKYIGVLNNGTEVQLAATITPLKRAMLTPQPSSTTPTPTFSPAKLAVLSEVKLGQTAVALGNSNGALTAAPGIIADIVLPEAQGDARGFVRTTITSSSLVPGSPLVNTKGEVIGLASPQEIGLFQSVSTQ